MTPRFDFVSGNLSLDFANVRKSWTAGAPTAAYDNLLAWSAQAGTLSDRGLRALARAATRQPAVAGRVARRAGDLGQAIERTFTSLLATKRPRPKDLAVLNRELATAMGKLQLVIDEEGFELSTSAKPDDLDQVLWPIARSAAELLTSGDLGRIKACDNETCNWLFYDRSKSRRRRWCDMKSCGNVAKARRFRERHRHGT